MPQKKQTVLLQGVKNRQSCCKKQTVLVQKKTDSLGAKKQTVLLQGVKKQTVLLGARRKKTDHGKNPDRFNAKT